MATAYFCSLIASPRYGPQVNLISAISQASPAVITTQSDHGYVTGTIVRLVIPRADGMQQLDNTQHEITVTASDTFTIPIDTQSYDPFAIPGAPGPHDDICALVIPIGENNGILTAAVRNIS